MSAIDDMLAEQAKGAGQPSIQDMLDMRARGEMGGPDAEAGPPAPKPLAAGTRLYQGFTDLPVGLGQLAEHVAQTPLNWARAGIRAMLPDDKGGALFAPVSAGGFDDIVRQRESDYQAARAAAQQSGIDWWRLGGTVADPLNYAGPGKIAGTVAGRIGAGAVQGAAVSAAQPSTTPGNYWYDKAKGALTGAATGGIISGAIEGAIPLIKAGINAARKAFGTAAPTASPAASAAVHTALASQGVDPATVDINVLSGLKQQAQEALEHGAEIDPEAVAARAQAESLPFPIRLMKGQATGNAMQFAKEQNLRGIVGVGEPLTERITEQNAAMLNNLDALGAKNAPNPVSTGQQISDKVQSFWDQLQSRKEALYDSVKNSAGQPAAMDQFSAVNNIRAQLDTPQASHAFDLLPQNIQRTLGELEDGKIPLTVAQAQSFDKLWGQQARGTSDGSVAHAINVVRSEIMGAPLADSAGEDARNAYMAAKSAHAQQMALTEPKLLNGQPNPQFQPLVKAVVIDGKPPESLFQSHFMGAAPSVAKGNLAFLGQLDPSMPEAIGKTYMGEIKRQALNNASEGRGTVSNAVLSGFARDPVNAARMDALLPAPQVQTFRTLAAAVENAKRFPTGTAVNTSNSGSAIANVATSALKAGALEKLSAFTDRVPVLGPILNAKTIAAGAKDDRLKAEVAGALNPGVTLKSLLTATPAQATRRAVAGRLAIPAAVTAEGASNEK